MKSLILLIAAFGVHAHISCAQTKIPKRGDSFFGLHFDFHATMNDQNIGKGLNGDATRQFLLSIKPDFIEVDAKGHNGVSSYPTRVGYHPAITGDPLKFYRDITSSLGIGLYAHVSGIIDAEAINRHPAWGRQDQSGEMDKKNVSIFSPYKDSVFIPQLKELGAYGLDGVWIDGDIWSVYSDYNRQGLSSFARAVGTNVRPLYGANTVYNGFVTFQEGQYLDYARSYINNVHSYKRAFQIGVNGAFTSIMPTDVNIPVDFLSVDIPSTKDLGTVELEARFLDRSGLPWDVMTWGFNNKGIKPVDQLEREIACIIALGGGFQLYFTQNRDASLPLNLGPVLKEVATFARKRQPYCFKSEPVPEVAVLYPSGSASRFKKIPFKDLPEVYEPAKSMTGILLNNAYQVNILVEDDLANDMMKYPVIAIANWQYINTRTLSTLKQYVSSGGRLLVTGAAVKYFKGATRNVITADVIDGTIISSLKSIYPQQLVSTDISDKGTLRAVLAKKGSNQVLNIINISGGAPVSVDVAMKRAAKPGSVWSLTQNKELPVDYSNGVAHFSVPAVAVHDVIVIK